MDKAVFSSLKVIQESFEQIVSKYAIRFQPEFKQIPTFFPKDEKIDTIEMFYFANAFVAIKGLQ